MATHNQPTGQEWRFWMGRESVLTWTAREYPVFNGTMQFRGPGVSGKITGESRHPFPEPDPNDDALAFRRAIAEGLVRACGGSVTWADAQEDTDATHP